MAETQLRQLVAKSVKFIVIFLLIDLLLGYAGVRIYFNQKSGRFARLTYAIEETNADVLIFGSSRANRNLIPALITDQTCYNAGIQGQKLIFHSALQKMILKRTTPELIILSIDENWLFKANEAYDRLNELHPYYWTNRDILKPVLSLRSQLIDLQMLFNSYRSNSTLIHALKYFLSPQSDQDGYVPLYGKMRKFKTSSENTDAISVAEANEIDPDFVAALESFISNAQNKNIDLIFVIPPTCYGIDATDNESMKIMTEMAAQAEITIYDFSNDARFLQKYELFKDGCHLNNDGASTMSTILADIIKK